MSDEIEEIIKSRTLTGELRSPAGERWLYTEDDLRAVAEAARRALVKELLDCIDVCVLVDGPEQGIRKFKTRLREIAGEA